MSEETQQFEKRIDLGDGSGVQVFRGESWEEVSNKLADAQLHASRKIRQQAMQLKTGIGLLTPDPDEPIPQFKPRSLTADEQWKLSQDLADPSKAADAITTIVEARTGVPISRFSEVATAVELQRRANTANVEATEWVTKHPEYYQCQENSDAIFGYLEKHKMACTKNNIDIAYQDLSDSGLLKTRPEVAPVKEEPKEEESQPQERIVPRPRTSTLRPGTSSSTGMPLAKPSITWEAIDKMRPAEYDERMRDAAFRKAVDALPPRR